MASVAQAVAGGRGFLSRRNVGGLAVVLAVALFTLVPALVFLRLSDNRSLNDHGATFFLEWALVYLVIAAASLALVRWSLRSLAKVGGRPSPTETVTSS